jgi:hypothetical protein
MRGWKAYVPLSLLVLLPVYWQPRVQAGDLASHIYNAWLAQLIGEGRLEGLRIVGQTTNVLFDLLLGGLFRVGGAEFAQRAAVSIAVLIFVWGAFRLVSVVAGRAVWHLLPCIAALAYGWVFHMGFFNFYLSFGLCFWVLSLVWEGKRRALTLAAPLALLAYVAHALPVAWMCGLAAYSLLARRVSSRMRTYVAAAIVLSMTVIHLAIRRAMFTDWDARQISMSTGADQLLVFNDKYWFVMFGLLLIWAVLFTRLVREAGVARVIFGVPFQWCVLSAAAVVVLPTTILIPGFQHVLAYIAGRMSLGIGICACVLLGTAIPTAYERVAMAGVAAVFFGFLFRDERILNALEDRIDAVVAQLPPGQRVISAVDDPNLHVFAVTHMIDRACVGRCYSFGNYEPSTSAFRIRTVGPNPYVTAGSVDSWKIQDGSYLVRESDLPLLQLYLDAGGRLGVRSLKAGSKCGSTPLDLFRAG